MSDDSRKDKAALHGQGAPEPPRSYDPGNPSFSPKGAGPDMSPGEFDSIRRMVTAAQVMALVSLVIGGVALSTVALGFAVAGYRRIGAAQPEAHGMDTAWALLRRSSLIALVVCACALTLNAISLAIIYPVVMQALETGDFDLLASGLSAGNSSTAPEGTSTWG